MNPPDGDLYAAAVARRGGHEHTGGPTPWEPTPPYQCPGCPLCQNNPTPNGDPR